MKTAFLAAALVVLACISHVAVGDDTKQANPSANANTTTGTTMITGCLAGPDNEGIYTLKTRRHTYEVGGLSDLKGQVGHEVSLTGTWVKTNAEIIGKQTASKTEDATKHERHMKVSAVHHVSEACKSSQTGTEKNEKKQ